MNRNAQRLDRKRRDWIGLAILVVIIVVLAYLTYAAMQQSRREHALENAVYANNVVAIRSLLDQGIYTKPEAEEALNYTVTTGNTKIMGLLLDHGVSPNLAASRLKNSLVQSTAGRGDTEATRLLLEHGADPNCKTDHPSALETAVLFHIHPDNTIIELLLAHDANPNVASGPFHQTPLSKAFGQGNLSVCELLLAKGADPNVQDEFGNPILIGAIQRKAYPFVNSLLARGAKVNVQDTGHMTPLICAAWDGKMDLARALLARGANVNADNGYFSVLWYAVDHNHADMVQLLLAHGADPGGKGGILQTARERKNAPIIDLVSSALLRHHR